MTAFVRDPSADEIGRLGRRLNQMAEQLQNLLQTREALATVEERNRIARDLHDSVKQQVFATAMQVGAARSLLESDPEAAASHLAQAEALVRQAQLELSGLIAELRPAALDDRGLGPALAGYARSWSQQTGIPAEIAVRGARRLPLPVEQSLFRVAQEALANVARHSGAAAVEVRLRYGEEAVTLVVADDGVGFDTSADGAAGPMAEFGLRSMRERMEGLGGTLTIESAPGRGTRLEAVAPVAPGSAAPPRSPAL